MPTFSRVFDPSNPNPRRVFAVLGESPEDGKAYSKDGLGRLITFVSKEAVVYTDTYEQADGILVSVEPFTVNGGCALGCVELFPMVCLQAVMSRFLQPGERYRIAPSSKAGFIPNLIGWLAVSATVALIIKSIMGLPNG